MNGTTSNHVWDLGEDSLVDDALGILLGVTFTLCLFLAIARFERTGAAEPSVELDNLRVVALPPEPPPPRVAEQAPAAEEAAPFAGLEIGASDSPVKIAVVPPELSEFLPVDAMPAAVIQSFQPVASFKPRPPPAADFNRVFRPTEVDQRPTRTFAEVPRVPEQVRGTAQKLTVRLLVVVDERGNPSKVRAVQTSGNAGFDDIAARTIEEGWLFTPAIKAGRRVKCLIEQSITVEWGGGSRFR